MANANLNELGQEILNHDTLTLAKQNGLRGLRSSPRRLLQQRKMKIKKGQKNTFTMQSVLGTLFQGVESSLVLAVTVGIIIFLIAMLLFQKIVLIPLAKLYKICTEFLALVGA